SARLPRFPCSPRGDPRNTRLGVADAPMAAIDSGGGFSRSARRDERAVSFTPCTSSELIPPGTLVHARPCIAPIFPLPRRQEAFMTELSIALPPALGAPSLLEPLTSAELEATRGGALMI